VNLVVRADASSAIGAGHVMRSLALAQAWRDAHEGAEVVFATASCPVAVAERLELEGCRLVSLDVAIGSSDDASALRDVIDEVHAMWVVLDGYAFDDAYEATVAEGGTKILAWDDDGHAAHRAATFVLNQNLYASAEAYADASAVGATLLLGAPYTCLRREVRAAGGARRGPRETVERVLVMGGGANAGGATERFVAAVEEAAIVTPGQLTVIIGGASDTSQALAEKLGEHGHTVLVNVNNPAEHMALADLAVTAAGSTSWELAFMGVPSLLTPVAPNQEPVATAAQKLGIARTVGPLRDVSDAELKQAIIAMATDAPGRAAMHAAGIAAIDGRGAGRVVSAMGGAELVLRPANAADDRLLFDWANDPVTRAASFSTETITWDEHVAWLDRKLRAPASMLFIATALDGSPRGQVRLDVDGESAEISVSVDQHHRGGGRGRAMIAAGVDEAFRTPGVERVRALIKPENDASVRAFKAVGFERVADELRGGRTSLAFEITPAKGERS
jgi:UDP-2,4-diacetamido-2,4,6-trideoxy-beta-L-altropyranose hydrolase